MSGSLEVRQFLLQQEELMARQSDGVPAQRTGDESRISAGQVQRARLAVAQNALGPEDCRQLLDMLGLWPGDDGTPAVMR